MRGSFIHGFKSLVRKIHPPLPLNPRESQKMLGLLKASHQKQLDARHPESTTEQSEATDAHFRTLLASPLFNERPPDTVVPGNGKPTQEHGLYESVQSAVRREMQEFDSGVAAGAMTLQELMVLLPRLAESLAKLNLREKSTLLELSQAGDRICHWLWASGTNEEREFLENRRLLNLLAPLLVQERHEKFLWKWVDDLNKTSLGPTTTEECALGAESVANQGYLIKWIVKRRALHGQGTSDACAVFLDIFQRLAQQEDHLDTRRRLRPAGIYLVHRLSAKSTVTEPALFESFVASCDTWTKSEVCKATLMMHHPQTPSPDYAMRFLRKLGSQELDGAPRSYRYTVLRLALETAAFMIEREDYANADWLMSFATQHFPEETKIPPGIIPTLRATSASDRTPLASILEELILPISNALRLRNRLHSSQL